jgi:hypothetical protein
MEPCPPAGPPAPGGVAYTGWESSQRRCIRIRWRDLYIIPTFPRRPPGITVIRNLLMAVEWGPQVLLCMLNRTKHVLLVSAMKHCRLARFGDLPIHPTSTSGFRRMKACASGGGGVCLSVSSVDEAPSVSPTSTRGICLSAPPPRATPGAQRRAPRRAADAPPGSSYRHMPACPAPGGFRDEGF